MSTENLSQRELDERAFDLAQAIHSTEMEGGHVTDEARAIMTDHAEGRIDEETMFRQIYALAGVEYRGPRRD